MFYTVFPICLHNLLYNDLQFLLTLICHWNKIISYNFMSYSNLQIGELFEHQYMYMYKCALFTCFSFHILYLQT